LILEYRGILSLLNRTAEWLFVFLISRGLAKIWNYSTRCVACL